MKTLLAFLPSHDEVKSDILKNILEFICEHHQYKVAYVTRVDSLLDQLEVNSRICAVLYDFDDGGLELCLKIQAYNPDLPVFAFTNSKTDIDISFQTLQYNLHFLAYRADQEDVISDRIHSTIDLYITDLIPPFTKALCDYAASNTYSYCTPGHADGSAFLRSPLGTLFYDFYGPNIFKSDLSVSMPELGSLLDHSGKHKEAEDFIAKQYGSNYCYIVTNGTSTSNKMVAMHVAAAGDAVLIDRNCHKSLAHFLMMSDVYPIYLKPSRNRYGIIGGISKDQFTRKSIEKKLALAEKQSGKSLAFPTYAVLTNSTYDGLLYHIDAIKNSLPIQNLHFDAAWIAYAPFSPIYQDHFAMGTASKANQVLYETYSTHKLLAAFSQSSMIHVKGEAFDPETFSDTYMMHASTSPFYPMVASTETAVAMMRGQHGDRLMRAALKESFTFRHEIERLRNENDQKHGGWFYDILQPADIGQEIRCFGLKQGDAWHGFQGEVDHLSLDPIKITLLTPGLNQHGYDTFGIPACLIAKYLEYQDIVVEKTGPYSLLFLFGIGSDRSKSLKLLNELASFKRAFDDNQKIEKILPNLYQEAPRFYRRYTIQQLARDIHQLYQDKDLCGLLYSAYETIPEMVLTPYEARQKIVRQCSKRVYLQDLMGKVCSEMLLPYPPGIPLIFPGERVTEASRAIVDFLMALCFVGDQYPGIETSIHGIYYDSDGQPYTHVIDDVSIGCSSLNV